MKMHTFVSLSICLGALLLVVGGARADGIIIPDPPICDPLPCPPVHSISQLAIRYHHVTVQIQDQVAVTHVDQVFFNPNDWAVEGTYLFPIPVDAAVTAFTLWVDGKPIQGQVLDAQQARQTYEQIVRSQRDPALLEYAGRGAVQAHIFPIPPQGERRIELEYTQALPVDQGLVHYVYPLNTEKFSTLPLDSVTIRVEIRSSIPVQAVYSPTHAIDLNRESESHIIASYEASNLKPDSDFALVYSLGEEQAFHLLSFRDPSDAQDPEGFFLLMLAPRPASAQTALPKDLILILDHSGSMEGEKFSQAQAALSYILTHLNPEDRFNIIAFSTRTEQYASHLQPTSQASQALSWVDRLAAAGSTDINRALLEAAAMVDPERPAYAIFLTDGLPTEGEVDSGKILQNLSSAAPQSLRLFSFGVGTDVDTYLLDSLSQAHHGLSTYVRPGEKLDEVLSGFYTRISTPVLTDVQLDFGSISVYDLYPNPLPDLFAGSTLIVAGRYHGEGGTATVTVRGQVNGQAQTFSYPEQVFSSQTSSDDVTLAALPRLWATRKIGYLLSQVRLQGADQETVDQIVRLSIRYGIVTEYTSYLVTEELPLGSAEQDRIASQQFQSLANATEAVSGAPAVQKAAGQGALAGAEAAPSTGEASGKVRIVGARAFVFSNGVWVDTAYDPDTMKTTKVAFLSADYFALIAAQPDLGAAFALGERVTALAQGIAYEVIPADEPAPPLAIPATPTADLTLVDQPSLRPSPTPLSTLAPAPGFVPCGAAILPLLLWGLVLIGFQRRRR